MRVWDVKVGRHLTSDADPGRLPELLLFVEILLLPSNVPKLLPIKMRTLLFLLLYNAHSQTLKVCRRSPSAQVRQVLVWKHCTCACNVPSHAAMCIILLTI